MNYQKIYLNDMINGEGIRVTLFLSGCSHKCRGCYNQSTWNPSNGKHFSKEVEDKILEQLGKPYIKGLSVSGGDPLNDANVFDLVVFLSKVKTLYPNKDIWLWTGYTLDEIVSNKDSSSFERCRYSIYLNYVDVLIDGKFIEELKDPSLLWRGSSNQIIHIRNL